MTSKLHKFLITLFLSLLILPVFTICTFAETKPSVFSVNYASQIGTLSGYGSGSISGSNTHDGEFWVDVTGTWSSFAGCTIKTSGFSENDSVIVTVYDQSGNQKCSRQLEGSSSEKKNIPIFNVSPGRYHVTIWVSSRQAGIVQCWIY